MRFRSEFLLILLMAVVTAWLALGGRRLPAWLGGARELPVRVVAVKKRTLAVTIQVSGRILPVRVVHVASRLAGKIKELRCKIGDMVNAGSIVAAIDSTALRQRRRDLETTLTVTRNDLFEQEQRLAAAEETVARRQRLFQQDLIARREVEQARAAAQTAAAQVELARAHLAQQQSMLAQARKLENLGQVTAPISGVIYRRWAEPGATVAESSPILTIADGRLVKFVGRVAGEGSTDLREGLRAVISRGAGSGAESEGQIARLVRTEQDREVVTEMEISVQSMAADFPLGTEASALVTLDRVKEILLVPRTAIVEQAGRQFLYKLAGGHAQRQEVETGAWEGKDVTVLQGVRENDIVIVDRLDSVESGTRVRPSMVAPLAN